MRKEVLIFVFLITLTSSVYSLQCLTGTTPTSSNFNSNLRCGPEPSTENCVDPDYNGVACSTFVCMDDAFSLISGQVGATYLGLCESNNCASSASKTFSFTYGVLSGELFPHGGYIELNPHDSLETGCCGDDSTGSNSVERQFPASAPGDGYGSRCCATPTGDSPEIVYQGYCCGIGATTASNIQYVDADSSYNACNAIESTSQGLYMCNPSGELIVNLQTSEFGSPGMTCGTGSESCYQGGTCCGDDLDEYSLGCKIDQYNLDGSACPPGVWTCEDEFAACKWGSTLYNPNQVTDLNDNSSDTELCINLGSNNYVWADLDQYDQTQGGRCITQGYTWIGSTNTSSTKCEPKIGGRWNDSSNPGCDDALPFDINFCCGDDQFEFPKLQGTEWRCCASGSSNYNDCIMPTSDTLTVDIISPTPGLIGQNVIVQSSYIWIGPNPVSDLKCAVNTQNSPAQYTGSDINGWSQTTSISNKSGTVQFILAGLSNGPLTITTACYDSSIPVYGSDNVLVQVSTGGFCNSDNTLDPEEECIIDSNGNRLFHQYNNTCAEALGIPLATGDLGCTTECTIDTSLCNVCGTGEYELGYNEQCEFRGETNFLDLVPGHTCQPSLNGQDFYRCTDSCECAYSNDPYSGYSIRYSGTCDGIDNLGIGTATDTLVTFYSDGTNSSTTLPERNCVGLQVNEPFMGPISILILLTILFSFYYFRKKLSN